VPAALRSRLGKSLRSAPDEPLRATVAGAVHHGAGHRADRLLTFGDAVEIAEAGRIPGRMSNVYPTGHQPVARRRSWPLTAPVCHVRSGDPTGRCISTKPSLEVADEPFCGDPGHHLVRIVDPFAAFDVYSEPKRTVIEALRSAAASSRTSCGIYGADSRERQIRPVHPGQIAQRIGSSAAARADAPDMPSRELPDRRGGHRGGVRQLGHGPIQGYERIENKTCPQTPRPSTPRVHMGEGDAGAN
jgi:hypothetical protein